MKGKRKHTSSIQEIMRVSRGALCRELRAENQYLRHRRSTRVDLGPVGPRFSLIASTSHCLSSPPIPRMRMMALNPGSPKGLLYELCCLDLTDCSLPKGPEGLVIHTKQPLGLGPVSQGFFLLCQYVFSGLSTFPRMGGRA